MKFLLLAAGLLAAAPAAQAEMKWNGSFTYRYTILNQDNNLGTSTAEQRVRRHQFRADLGTASKGDTYDWGVTFRTFSAAGSEYSYLQNNLDLGVSLGEAYFRPHYTVLGTDVAVTIGRQKNVILYDANGQNLFDKDNRFDGLGWTFQHGMFGFAMNQYVLGARTGAGVFGSSSFTKNDATEATANDQRGFGYLFSFQPNVKFKVSDEVSGVFAVGYHHWTGTNDAAPYRNNLHGGYGAPTSDYVVMSNPRQWQIFTEWTLPMKLKFTGEYIWNKQVNYTNTNVATDKSGLGLTLAYGSAKKRNDFALAYTYADRGLGSSIQNFSWSDLPVDNTAHVLDAKFALDDGLVLGARGYLMKEKSKRDVSGNTLTNNQETKQQRYEVTAGVAF